ncbi:MAG: PHP domain-containing protein, partial [Planctomycetota bacterium]
MPRPVPFRPAAEERVAVVRDGTETELRAGVTIAAHDYHRCYYPGSHPYADRETVCRVRREGAVLHVSIRADEPALAALLPHVEAHADAPFFAHEFVALHLLDAQSRLVQLGAKPDGRTQALRDGKAWTPRGLSMQAEADGKGWTVEVALPLGALGSSGDALDATPIPFDLVRHSGATGAITAWSPIPDQLPFNELYDFPVFCFGLLAGRPVDWARVARPPKLGRLRYRGPKRVAAGTHFGYRLAYTAGPHGLARGGALKLCLVNEVIECNRRTAVPRHLLEKDWTPPQWDAPDAPGYVEVTSSRSGARFRLERGEDLFSFRARLTAGGPLAPGETVTVAVGETGPGMRAQLLAQEAAPLKAYVDPFGRGLFYALPRFPAVAVTGRAAQSFAVHAASTPRPGEPFRLVIVALDACGNVADRHRGPVQLHAPVPLKGLPKALRFAAADRGVLVLTARAPKADPFVITAVDPRRRDCAGTSELVVTDGSFGPEPLFFGDIHTHSQLSDGRLPPEEKVREVALQRGADFWALTDHCHDLTPARTERLNRVL